MARISEEDRREAVIIDAQNAGIVPVSDDSDAEGAWDEWIKSTRESEGQGIIRAYKLPLDKDGNPMHGKGARQVLLGSWAHDLYTFDQLCQKLTNEFLKPGETAHIRLQGNQSGQRGNMLNRIVTLQRSAVETALTPQGGSGSVVEMMKMMQEGQAQMAQMMERILTKPEPEKKTDFTDTLLKLSPLLAPLLPVIAQRFLSPPKSDLEGLIGAMVKLKDLTGDGGGGGGDDESIAGMVKAIAPGALQVMAQMAARQPVQAASPQARRIPVRQVPPQQTATPAPVVPTPTATTEEIPPMLAQLKPQLDQLADIAAAGADPVETAKLVMDTLPANEEFDEVLYQQVADPSKFKRLFLISPKLGQHADWAEKLRLAILAEYEEPDSVPNQAPPQSA